MAFLADKMGRPLHEIRDMPMSDYYTMLNYYSMVAEREAEAHKKTRGSGGSGRPSRRPAKAGKR